MAIKKKRLKSLSQGRPPTIKNVSTISSKATRSLIRSHHTLQKQKAKALADGDTLQATAIAAQIEKQGGLTKYQQASLLGQANSRGGDSSKILMEWLRPFIPEVREDVANGFPIRMLEVGALSVMNACSRSGLFEMERIDLNSQGNGIKQQDFMTRPLPLDGSERFDIVSLSLVVNYVSDAVGRGEMLKRTLQFLNPQGRLSPLRQCLPSLFLVLPSSCVTNSRYLDENRLEAIMRSLGYIELKKKLSNKLVYYLWCMQLPVSSLSTNFKKEEIRSGKSRNNFAIVMKSDDIG